MRGFPGPAPGRRWALGLLAAASALGLGRAAGAPRGGSLSLQARLNRTYATLPRGRGGLPGASAVRYLARRYLRAEHGWVAKGLDLEPLAAGVNASALAARRASAVLRVPRGLPVEGKDALRAVLEEEPERGFSLEEAAGFVGALEHALVDSCVTTLRRAMRVAADIRGKGGESLQSVLYVYGVLTRGGRELESKLARLQDKEEVRARLARSVRSFDKEFEEMLETTVFKVSKYLTGKPGTIFEKALKGARMLQMQFAHFVAKQCGVFRSTLSKQDTLGSGQLRLAGAWGTSVHRWALVETPEFLSSLGVLVKKGVYGGGPGLLIPNYISSMSGCTEPAHRHFVYCCPDECEEEVIPRIEVRADGPRVAAESVWAAVRPLLKSPPRTRAAREALRSELGALGRGPNDTTVAVHGRPLARWLHRAFPDKCRMPVAGPPLVVDPALLPNTAEAAGVWVAVSSDEVLGIKNHLNTRWGADRMGSEPASFAWRSRWTLHEEFVLISRLLKERRDLRGPDHDNDDEDLRDLQVAEALEDALNMRILAATAETGSVGSNPAYHLLAAAAAVGGSPVFAFGLHAVLRVVGVAASVVMLPVVAGLVSTLSPVLSALAAMWAALRRVGSALVGILCRRTAAKADPKLRQARPGPFAKAREAAQHRPQPQEPTPPQAATHPERQAIKPSQAPTAPPLPPESSELQRSRPDDWASPPAPEAAVVAPPEPHPEPAATDPVPQALEPPAPAAAGTRGTAILKSASSWADMHDNDDEPPCPSIWAAADLAGPPERPRGLQLVSALVGGKSSTPRAPQPAAKLAPSAAPARAQPTAAPPAGACAHGVPPTAPPSQPPTRGLALVKGLLGSRPQHAPEPPGGLAPAAAQAAPATAPPRSTPSLRVPPAPAATGARRWQEPRVAAGGAEAPAPAAVHGVPAYRGSVGGRALPVAPSGPAPAALARGRTEAHGNGGADRGAGHGAGGKEGGRGSTAPREAAATAGEARASGGDPPEDEDKHPSRPLDAWFRRRVFELRVMVSMGTTDLLGVLEALTDEQLAPPYAEAKMWLGLDEGEPLPEALEGLVSEFLARRRELRGVGAESVCAPGRASAGSEGSPGKSGEHPQRKPKGGSACRWVPKQSQA